MSNLDIDDQSGPYLGTIYIAYIYYSASLICNWNSFFKNVNSLHHVCHLIILCQVYFHQAYQHQCHYERKDWERDYPDLGWFWYAPSCGQNEYLCPWDIFHSFVMIGVICQVEYNVQSVGYNGMRVLFPV